MLRGHPSGDSIIQEIKQKDVLARIMQGEINTDFQASTPVKARAQPSVAAPAASVHVDAEEGSGHDSEFAEPDEEEAVGETSEESKRTRKAPTRFEASAPVSKRPKAKSEPKSDPKAAVSKPGRGQKPGPRGRDSEGNAVKMQYNRQHLQPLPPQSMEESGMFFTRHRFSIHPISVLVSALAIVNELHTTTVTVSLFTLTFCMCVRA